jgi:hypothetical protein
VFVGGSCTEKLLFKLTKSDVYRNPDFCLGIFLAGNSDFSGSGTFFSGKPFRRNSTFIGAIRSEKMMTQKGEKRIHKV